MKKKKQLHQEEEEAVTPCTRDYVATNGWLSKGRNRLTSGTARNPCFKRLKTHAQRALNAKNGRNRNERDERVTPAQAVTPSWKKKKKQLHPHEEEEVLHGAHATTSQRTAG
jgi:hypothetical protein